MKLNETKAIAGVPMPGSYSLYNYFSNAHPILSIIIKIENKKYNFACISDFSKYRTVK